MMLASGLAEGQEPLVWLQRAKRLTEPQHSQDSGILTGWNLRAPAG